MTPRSITHRARRRIAEVWFTESVTIEPYLGDSSYGPRYGPPVAHPAAFDPARKVIRAGTSAETVASATALVAHDLDVPLHSRLTWRGDNTYDVAEVLPQMAPGGVLVNQLILS